MLHDGAVVHLHSALGQSWFRRGQMRFVELHRLVPSASLPPPMRLERRDVCGLFADDGFHVDFAALGKSPSISGGFAHRRAASADRGWGQR